MPGFALTWSRSRRSFAFAPLADETTLDEGPLFAAIDSPRSLQLAGRWRADNAQDLARTLGLRAGAPIHEVLAAGWCKWQTGLADRLRGPFAVTILEVESNTLYVARDFAGVEPLFYTKIAEGLALSSSPGIARALGDGTDPVDLASVSSFLDGHRTGKTETFYANVARLAPGHWMKLSPSGERVEPYWSVGKVEPRPSRADAAEHFRELLDRSVAASAAESGRPGVLLSGGLDSSAILASFAQHSGDISKLPSLSMTFRGNDGWADGKYIDALRQHFPMDHHDLPSEKHDPLASLDLYLPVLDGPCLGYGLSISNRLLPMAASLGCTSLFNGHGGDEVVSYGAGRLNELALRGHWWRLWREAEGAAHLSSIPQWKVFDKYLFHRPERRWLDRQWKRLRRPAITEPDLQPEVRSDDLLLHHLEEGPPQSLRSDPAHTERDLQISAIDAPLQAHALETLVLCGRHHGLETALPFFDRELVEFSVGLPSDWKLRNGYTRYILRKGMEGRVPDCVTWRRDKNDFTNDFQTGLIERSPQLRDLVSSSNSNLKGLVSPQWFDHIWSKVTQQGSSIPGDDARALWRVALLALWLGSDRRAQLPPKLRPIGVEGDV